MTTYQVTQTYWNTEDDIDNGTYYYATAIVEANTSNEAIQKACLEGMFDDQYEVPLEYLGIGDIYEVEEIEE